MCRQECSFVFSWVGFPTPIVGLNSRKFGEKADPIRGEIRTYPSGFRWYFERFSPPQPPKLVWKGYIPVFRVCLELSNNLVVVSYSLGNAS